MITLMNTHTYTHTHLHTPALTNRNVATEKYESLRRRSTTKKNVAEYTHKCVWFFSMSREERERERERERQRVSTRAVLAVRRRRGETAPRTRRRGVKITIALYGGPENR